jgi:hypothetical protein
MSVQFISSFAVMSADIEASRTLASIVHRRAP